MKLCIVGMICLGGWFVLVGCGKKGQSPPESPAVSPEAIAKAAPTTTPAVMPRTRMLRLAKTRHGQSDVPATTQPTPASSQSAQTESARVYCESAEQKIADTDAKAQDLIDGIEELSDKQVDKLDALLTELDDKTFAAYESLDDLAEAAGPQWKNKKLQLEHALEEQKVASNRLHAWLASIGKYEAEQQ